MGKQTVEAASSKSFMVFAQQSIGRPLSSEKKKNKIEKSFNPKARDRVEFVEFVSLH